MPPSPEIPSSRVLRVASRAWVLVALLLLVSCGGRDDSSPGDFRVALLLTGPISDDGWNASAVDGLLLLEKELGARVSTVESLDKSRFEENLREFAAQGYDLIFGHAYEFQDAVLRVASDFPETVFIVIAGNRHAANVGAVHFQLEEATYVLGALAARLSERPVAGMIGGEEIPSLKPGFDGFENGARSVNPDIQVVRKYVGNWHDVALAREHAEALIEQGAQFLFQNADKAGLGVFQAASAHEGVWAFGSNRDQNRVVPGAVLASAVLDVPAAYLSIGKAVRSGEYTPEAAKVGVAEGVVSVFVSPDAAASLGPEVAAFLAYLEQRIAAGEIDVLASPLN